MYIENFNIYKDVRNNAYMNIFFSMNTYLSTKIYNFLVNAEEEHITGASIIY